MDTKYIFMYYRHSISYWFICSFIVNHISGSITANVFVCYIMSNNSTCETTLGSFIFNLIIILQSKIYTMNFIPREKGNVEDKLVAWDFKIFSYTIVTDRKIIS